VYGILVAVQPNGEHLRYEAWVYAAWIHGQLTDPFLSRGLFNAVRTYWG